MTCRVVFALPLLLASLNATHADEKPLQGTWQVVGMEYDGLPVEKGTAEKFTVVFRDGKATFRGRLVGSDGKFTFAEGEDVYSITLDPAKKPAAIDLRTDESDSPMRGIYRLDGDRLELCIRFAGARPTKFTSKGEVGIGYTVLKRMPK